MSNIQDLLTSVYNQYPFQKCLYIAEYGDNKANLYNLHIDNPLQKVWIYIPKCRIYSIYKDKEQNILSLKLVFSTNDEYNKKLFQLLNQIEYVVKQFYITKLKKELTLKSIISGLPPTMNLSLKNTNINLFDKYDNKINVDQLNKLDHVEFYLELISIWTKNDILGFNLNILQMKCLPEIDFNVSLFKSCSPILTPIHVQVSSVQEPKPLPPRILLKEKPKPKEEPIGICFVPSVHDLKNKLLSLKSLKKMETSETEPVQEPEKNDIILEPEQIKEIQENDIILESVQEPEKNNIILESVQEPEKNNIILESVQEPEKNNIILESVQEPEKNNIILEPEQIKEIQENNIILEPEQIKEIQENDIILESVQEPEKKIKRKKKVRKVVDQDK
jgi:hypothetical protein